MKSYGPLCGSSSCNSPFYSTSLFWWFYLPNFPPINFADPLVMMALMSYSTCLAFPSHSDCLDLPFCLFTFSVKTCSFFLSLMCAPLIGSPLQYYYHYFTKIIFPDLSDNPGAKYRYCPLPSFPSSGITKRTHKNL